MPKQKTDKTAKDLKAVTDKIATFPEPYATIGTKLHETIINAGPKLKPRLWYGTPGYATGRSTPVLIFFRCDDGVFTLGLSEKATVEGEPDSTLRPCACSSTRSMTPRSRRSLNSFELRLADQQPHNRPETKDTSMPDIHGIDVSGSGVRDGIRSRRHR